MTITTAMIIVSPIFILALIAFIDLLSGCKISDGLARMRNNFKYDVLKQERPKGIIDPTKVV